MSVYAREDITDRLTTLIYYKHTYTTEGARARRISRPRAFAFGLANFYIQRRGETMATTKELEKRVQTLENEVALLKARLKELTPAERTQTQKTGLKFR